MGRLYLLLALICGCSYTAPGASDDQPSPDSPPPPDGSSPDSPVIPPDTQPPDGPPPEPTTTDHVSAQDTWLESDQPTLNHGGETFVITDGDILATSLLRFDLTGLSTAATVSKVDLHIFTDFDPGAEVRVFRVLESWTEGGATWNRRNATTNWLAAGAAPPSTGATPIGTFTPGTQFTEFTVAIDAATVQSWIADPASNFGLGILSVNANGPRFTSREATNGKPFLRITHTP